jgi:hypothetical protein
MAKFSLKTFFEKLFHVAPTVLVAGLALTAEAKSGASNIQLANDSLAAATGITEAMASDDPAVQADAATASAAVSQVIEAVATAPVVTTTGVQVAVVHAALATSPVAPTPAPIGTGTL